jgi:hypothetical protein
MDCVGLVLLAKWPRAALAFAPASFSLSRVITVPREQPDDVGAKATAAADRVEKYVLTMIDGT